MLIKPADDKTQEIKILEQLSLRSDISAATKNNIEQEVKNIRSGVIGEKDAAYHINFHFEPSKNWAVIHDLRLEHGGRSAQIDHLLINRLLEIYVCESKRFGEGIEWNERGEFSYLYGGRRQGIQSPVEQNRKHINLLNALCNDGALDLPRRLGFAIKPIFNSLILVSTNAHISRPKSEPKLDAEIIKADQIQSFIENDAEASSPLALSKLISMDTLTAFAKQLASRHQPKSFDWRARFGIPVDAALKVKPRLPIRAEVADRTDLDGRTEVKRLSANKPLCASCGKIVSAAVAKYCTHHKARFSDRILCMDCQ